MCDVVEIYEADKTQSGVTIAEMKKQCQDAIFDDFIEDALHSARWLLVVKKKQRNAHRICGAAMAQHMSKDVLYLDLICSDQHKGKLLMRKVEELARSEGYKRVALRAGVKELIPYYEKRGYTEVENACTASEKPAKTTQARVALMRKTGGGMVKDDMVKNGWWMTKCVASPKSRTKTAAKLCLSCRSGDMVRSLAKSGVAEWIKVQGRLSAVPPNAPPPSHPVYGPRDGTVKVSHKVGGRARKVLWWGAEPRHVKASAKVASAPAAYGYYTNMGIAVVRGGRLEFKACAPQPYREEGTVWPAHFHYVEAKGSASWKPQVHTVAGYPGHHEGYSLTHATGHPASDMCSILTPAQVHKHRQALIAVNALPLKYAPIDVPHSMHVPYDGSPGAIATAAKKLGTKPYVVYCAHAKCSAGSQLIAKLVAAGATNVFYMPAGIRGWRRMKK